MIFHVSQDSELAAKDVEICNLKSVVQSEARKAEETLALELKLRDEAHAAELLRKDASMASTLSRKDAELAEMGGRLAEAERGGGVEVATLQRELQRVEDQLQAKVCSVCCFAAVWWYAHFVYCRLLCWL